MRDKNGRVAELKNALDAATRPDQSSSFLRGKMEMDDELEIEFLIRSETDALGLELYLRGLSQIEIRTRIELFGASVFERLDAIAGKRPN